MLDVLRFLICVWVWLSIALRMDMCFRMNDAMIVCLDVC